MVKRTSNGADDGGTAAHPAGDMSLRGETEHNLDLEHVPPEFADVLRSAARLQEVVPDAVLVGGTVSALYARHRVSYDHDHVLQLQHRYNAVLEAVEATDGWATSVRASKPPMTIMGKLGGVEAGLRQLRRTMPLETQILKLSDGETVRIPTLEEALRIKAYLVVQRDQMRDYLDVVALADDMGIPSAAATLSDIDRFYADRSEDDESVVSALVAKLAKPQPRDRSALADLSRYKHLNKRWHSWSEVQRVSGEIADAILRLGEGATK